MLLLFHIYDLFNAKNYRDCDANRLGFLLGSPSCGKGTCFLVGVQRNEANGMSHA